MLFCYVCYIIIYDKNRQDATLASTCFYLREEKDDAKGK